MEGKGEKRKKEGRGRKAEKMLRGETKSNIELKLSNFRYHRNCY